MRTTTFFLTLLCCTLAVHAAWYNAGDTFTRDGKEFYIDHELGEDRVFLSAGDQSFIIPDGECVQATSEEYCVISIEENTSSDKVTFVDGEKRAGIQLEFNDIGPDLTFERSIETTDLRVGESTTVEVTVSNDGQTYIGPVTYRDEYPDELDIVEKSDQVYEQQIALSPGASETFEYTITARDFVTYTSRVNISFTAAGENVTKAVEDTFTVDAPYTFETAMPDNVRLGETATLTITIESKDDDIYSGDLTTEILGVTNETYVGDVTDAETITRSWQAITPGRDEVQVTFTFDTDERDDVTIERVVPYNITYDPLNLSITTSPTTVTAGSTMVINASATNPSEQPYTITNPAIKGLNKTNVFATTEIGGGETISFVTNRDIGNIPAQRSEQLRFTGTYTIRSTTLQFSKATTVDLKPTPTAFNLSIDAPTAATPGSEVTVTATLTNNGQNNVDLDINYAAGGSHDTTVTVSPGSTTSDTHTFTMGDGQQLIIVTASANNVTAQDSTVVNVDDVADEPRGQPTPPPSESTEQGTNETGDAPQQTNAWVALIDTVGNFFTWLFS
jgi:hypothetical protein